MGMLPRSAARQFGGDDEHKTTSPVPAQSGGATWPLVPLPSALFLRLRIRSARELTVPGPAPPCARACSASAVQLEFGSPSPCVDLSWTCLFSLHQVGPGLSYPPEVAGAQASAML